jgi:signal peptidase I
MATRHRNDRIAAAARRLTAPVEEAKNFVADWAGLLLIYLFATTALLQAFVVPTGSMTSTLLIGDHLIVDKLTYSPPGAITGKLLPYSKVQRGDVIVFRYPLDIRESYVKRVIGVPGDRIRFENKQLILNGARVHEPYLRLLPEQRSYYLNNFPAHPDIPLEPRAQTMLSHVVNGELVVPPGQYFALGDNRDESADSRFWGFVPKENITGKPLLIWWSYDAPTERLNDRNLINIDHIADLGRNFFRKTRWDRTFRLVRSYKLQAK